MSIVLTPTSRAAGATTLPFGEVGETLRQIRAALRHARAATVTGSAEGDVEQAAALAQAGEIDLALDVTFSLFDSLLRTSQLGTADTLLFFWDLPRMGPAVTVGALMATYPDRAKLRSRANLLARLESELVRTMGHEEAEKTVQHLR